MPLKDRHTLKTPLANAGKLDIPREVSVEAYFRWLSSQKLEFRHPAIEELYHYYEEKCPAPGQMPARADIELKDIVSHLPHIVLSEIVDDPAKGPASFLCRVFGTVVTEIFGMDLSRRHISEYPNQARAMRTYFIHRYVAETKKPLCIYGPLVDSGKDYLKTEGLFLPLSDDKKTVNMILCELRFEGIS